MALNQDETQLASDESNQSLQSAEAEVATDEQGVSTDQAAATAAQAALATLQAQDQATLQQDESAVSGAEQTLATDTTAADHHCRPRREGTRLRSRWRRKSLPMPGARNRPQGQPLTARRWPAR